MAQHVHKIPGDIYRAEDELPEDLPLVKGYDFNQGVNYPALLKSYLNTGLQASKVAVAIELINTMIKKREEPVEGAQDDEVDCHCKQGLVIYLSYTSNLVSSGVRESIRYLAEHKKVDVLVTTAGGIEEDLIKCLGPVFVGDFSMSGRDLYKRGLNRNGNTLMADSNYYHFDKWIMPILEEMLVEQNTKGVRWTPSKMIHRLGKEINNPESICYWAYKNNIPMFSPGLTDGALGDMFYLFSKKSPGLVLDIIGDVTKLNNMVLAANRTGIILLGGGLAKHHVCNANSWRDGADFAVYINTAQEFDGCDSGASPDEALSWGKINQEAKYVKVFADVSIIFPLMVAETFARGTFACEPTAV